ncbi:hypothetical protein OO014_12425 [Intrasporangium calvum]|uniref:MinD-like ATPase involved in chromosome partitioning or flagellar assembly n=1 Tax=Intrasporangium calvum TaxID=53358 RepID=A0ABT5GJA3_9MICO|nr:hypothetical protein [Intrasporangium calvum]MDC5698066.1 hypothetical protein [Intrasporangium calvum]
MLTSASGSPGATTTAVGLALAWPRPVVLVEADPTGGSPILAGYFRGTVAPARGLIDLALAHRDDHVEAALPGTLMPIPDPAREHQAWLLPGIRSHAQARSLTHVWEPLRRAFHALERTGQDVIVDAGRLGLTGSPDPLIRGADLTLLTVRTDLVSLSGAKSWAQTLRDDVETDGATGTLGLLLVGDRRPYAAADVAKVLGLPVASAIAWDPPAAAVFSHGASPPRRFESSPLVRSLHAARAAIQATVAARRAAVTPAQHADHYAPEGVAR